jgi:phage terminase small subunit
LGAKYNMPRTAAAALAVAPVAANPKRLKPPDTLSTLARDEFVRIVMAEKADHFRPSDLPLLVQYCEAAALAARAVQELQNDDAKASWLIRWEKACRTLTALSARLRLCPQSRIPNNPTRPKSTSYYDQMRLEGHLDGGAQQD